MKRLHRYITTSAVFAQFTACALAAPPGGQKCNYLPQFDAGTISTATPTVCVGTSVTFTSTPVIDTDTCDDPRTSPTDTMYYDWSFGDGATLTTIDSPSASHTYTSCSPTGGYSVSVTYRDKGNNGAKDNNRTSNTISVTVGANWSLDTGIGFGGITSPANNAHYDLHRTNGVIDTQITVTCAKATDSDIKNCGTPESVAETQFQYIWSATGGKFPNGTASETTGSPSIVWTPPGVGSFTISVKADDVTQVSPPDCGNRDDDASAESAITVLLCAHPIEFRYDAAYVDSRIPSTLICVYSWASSSGDIADLSHVIFQEHLTYPGGNPYVAPAPFAKAYSNPFDGAMGQGGDHDVAPVGNGRGSFVDDHSEPFINLNLIWFSTAEFTVTQTYQYQDGICDPNEWVDIMGPNSIHRQLECVQTNCRAQYSLYKDNIGYNRVSLPAVDVGACDAQCP